MIFCQASLRLHPVLCEISRAAAARRRCSFCAGVGSRDGLRAARICAIAWRCVIPSSLRFTRCLASASLNFTRTPGRVFHSRGDDAGCKVRQNSRPLADGSRSRLARLALSGVPGSHFASRAYTESIYCIRWSGSSPQSGEIPELPSTSFPTV